MMWGGILDPIKINPLTVMMTNGFAVNWFMNVFDAAVIGNDN